MVIHVTVKTNKHKITSAIFVKIRNFHVLDFKNKNNI